MVRIVSMSFFCVKNFCEKLEKFLIFGIDSEKS